MFPSTDGVNFYVVVGDLRWVPSPLTDTPPTPALASLTWVHYFFQHSKGNTLSSTHSMNAAVIVFIIVAIVLLAVIMVLSAMSAADINKSDACKKDKDGKSAHTFAMTNAIIAGITVIIIVVILIVYIVSEHHEKIAKGIGSGLSSAGAALLS